VLATTAYHVRGNQTPPGLYVSTLAFNTSSASNTAGSKSNMHFKGGMQYRTALSGGYLE